ncbi:hypothetical protein HRI_005014400 [Hibiscus trionum]|uniref:Fatty acid hydroxylase domain-containing protein n=1 Tax=Hibiscus trionum TaxID=183268 RepID=A0A9W7MU96_HIBTR|nr:hypothetical protein HRI_005014400 [Hibiscus trionum]
MAFGSFHNYRLHSRKDEEEKNFVSKANVIKNVLFQQTVQATLAIFFVQVSPPLNQWMTTAGYGFHIFFSNNSAYHDVHHHLYGGKYNFSQPFFVMWDRIMGTYTPYSLEKRAEGGFQARPIKRTNR